ncbi:MAG: radical SAM protein [Thermodesulforhabdaceae bacterium]
MSWKNYKALLELLRAESGHIIKDWGGKARVALVFPNTYFVGMSNLGFQTVYGLFNDLADVVCERCFYHEDESSPVLSLESGKPLHEFDMVLFSVPFEMDYPHVLEILLRSGIPLRSEDRTEIHPLVAAGGVTAFLNPQPLSPFMDFFFLGDAEVFVSSFWNFWRERPFDRTNRLAWLEELARSVDGIYVPALYVERYGSDGTISDISPIVPDLPHRIPVQKSSLTGLPPARTRIFTPNTEFSNTYLVEIGRGCGRGCRFCAAGFIYRPPRFHSAKTVLETVHERHHFEESASGGRRSNLDNASKAKQSRQCEQSEAITTAILWPCDERVGGFPSRWGLVSAAIGDYPELDALAGVLIEKGVEVSFSSLRADGIKPVIKEIFQTGKHQAVAIAPEAGSERLRRVINKKLTDDQICEACVMLTEAGIRHLKLYFMIGLPTETDEDVEAIASLSKRIRHEVIRAARSVKNLGTIVVNINSFVPKPFTPFQWVPFDGVQSLKQKIKKIQKMLAGFSNLRVHSDVPKWAYLQALFARGDRRVGMILETVVKEKIGWSSAFRRMPWNPDFFVMRERGQNELFPWEIVDHGIDRKFLWKEYELAIAGKESPGCPLVAGCNLCGVCKALEFKHRED